LSCNADPVAPCEPSTQSSYTSDVAAEYTTKQRVMLATIPMVVAGFIRLLGATLRYEDHAASNVTPGDQIPAPTVFAFWHRSLLICAHRFRNKGIAILISRSFDGELIARTVERLGFIAVRGSSSRGGAGGLRGMQQAYSEGHICAFTADGPRGPAMVAKPGPVQLAKLVDAAWIGTFDALPDRCWRLNSWDGFLIPKPFACVVVSWAEHAAPELDKVQRSLDRCVELSTAAIAPHQARTGEGRDDSTS
jgi:lysophospholipid acyltransferase (LPLAT)-like uncharacterized protein